MDNLAGKDQNIAEMICVDELRRSRIPYEVYANLITGEVNSRIVGLLRGCKFTRAWRYWRVECKIPLELAKIIYADPASRDIRIAGHCGCVEPVTPWVKWYCHGGKPVFRITEKETCEKLLKTTMVKEAQEFLDNSIFSDDPESLGAMGFIESYHIDSVLGLRVFADYLTK